MKNTVREACHAVLDDVIVLRRKIHAHPEIGMETYDTAAFAAAELERLGIPYRITEKIGVIGEIKGTAGESDKIVALRADMDALAAAEKTGLPFASEIPGRMHACGHDIHTSTLLGSARVLNEMKDRFAGTVRLIFQPGEEIGKGAVFMVKHGVMDGVGMVLGLHVDPLSPVHTLNVRRGSDWAAVDHFWIRVKGISAHGATPQDGADAVIAAASIAMNLQTMVSRECDPMKPLVVTVGKLNAGSAFNIIAQEAVLEGTCRSFDRDVYEMIPAAMERVAVNIAKALKCTAEVEIDRPVKPLINSDEAYDVLKGAADKVLHDASDWREAKMAMIGEDFSEYGEYAPIVFGHLGCDGGYPLHSSYVNFKEEAIETGMAVEVQFALDALAYLNRKG